MSKKFRFFWAGLLCVLTTFLVLINISNSTSISSISRPYEHSQYTIIDSPRVPLAPSIGVDSLEAQTLAEVNEIRIDAGLKPLVYSENLTQDALTRAEECDDRFSHTRPNGTDWYTVDPDIMFGENLSQGYDSAEDVTDAWMNSRAHRELILEGDYQTCGIGSYEAADGVVYVAAEFGY